jgi:hypothetical protein
MSVEASPKALDAGEADSTNHDGLTIKYVNIIALNNLAYEFMSPLLEIMIAKNGYNGYGTRLKFFGKYLSFDLIARVCKITTNK